MSSASHADFAQFVAARGNALLRSAYLLSGGDQQRAEDLVQSALARTASKWKGIRGEPEAYVRRAIYHEHVSWWRSRRGLSEVQSSEEGLPAIASHDDGIVLSVALSQALRQLTPRQRAVLVLRYYEDLTEAQTADVLNCSVGTVKSTTSLALKRLRAAAPELADTHTTPM